MDIIRDKKMETNGVEESSSIWFGKRIRTMEETVAATGCEEHPVIMLLVVVVIMKMIMIHDEINDKKKRQRR